MWYLRKGHAFLVSCRNQSLHTAASTPQRHPVLLQLVWLASHTSADSSCPEAINVKNPPALSMSARSLTALPRIDELTDGGINVG